MVYSKLDIFTAVVCTRNGNSACKVGFDILNVSQELPTPLADIFIAVILTWTSLDRFCRNAAVNNNNNNW